MKPITTLALALSLLFWSSPGQAERTAAETTSYLRNLVIELSREINTMDRSLERIARDEVGYKTLLRLPSLTPRDRRSFEFKLKELQQERSVLLMDRESRRYDRNRAQERLSTGL